VKVRRCVVLLVILLAACGHNAPQTGNQPDEHAETIIEWVDFIKIHDKQYEALYTAAISEEDFIGEEIAQVEFNVNDNINDENYRIKNGDAAFWEEGTPIYRVKERPALIAVKDKQEINGYRLYQNENAEDKWTFDHVNQASITKIEIWKGVHAPELVNTIMKEDEMDRLLTILEGSTLRKEDVYHDTDPDYFDIVFYQEGPIANHYPLFHQEDEWYWLPWEEEVLSSDMKGFVEGEK